VLLGFCWRPDGPQAEMRAWAYNWIPGHEAWARISKVRDYSR